MTPFEMLRLELPGSFSVRARAVQQRNGLRSPPGDTKGPAIT